MSINHNTQAGDLVQLIGEKDKNYIVALKAGEAFQTHLGVIPHDELIGQPWGARVQSHLGKSFRILQPALDDLIRNLSRSTQIMYPKDIGYVLVTMNISPGKRVIEAGTGSGALTLALASLIGNSGKVYSYDSNENHQAHARENLILTGLDERVEFLLGDIQSGFKHKDVDALFLDLPEAHEFIAQAGAAIKPGGFFGCLLPTTNQVSAMIDALKKHGFEYLEVSELLHRYYKVSSSRLRPADKMTAHTGFLVFARRMTSYNEMEHF